MKFDNLITIIIAGLALNFIVAGIIFLTSNIAGSEESQKREKQFLVIGILQNTVDNVIHYNQTGVLRVTPLDNADPIDLGPGIKHMAKEGIICKIYGHNPKVGKCGLCGVTGT